MNKIIKKNNKKSNKTSKKLNKISSTFAIKKSKKHSKKESDFDSKLLKSANKIDKKLYDKTNFFRIKYNNFINKCKNFVKNNFGKTCFTVYGLNLVKLLNILKKFNIENVNISNELSFSVCSRYNKQIIKLLKDYNYKFTYKSISKTYKFFRFVYFKKALSFVIVLSIIFYLFTNLLVLKININNYSYEVNKILLKNNIKVGSFLSNVDTNLLEREIIKNLDISFCDIKIVGNTLDINITKSSNPVKTEKQDINKVVIATCDCILSRQLIYSGTATKKFGDIIKKGDILVNNYIYIDENNTFTTLASGDIYGLIQKSESITVNKKSVEKVETGNTKTITQLAFNNNFKPCKAPYELYKKVENTCLVSDILPLYKKTITFSEYQYKTINYDKNLLLSRHLDRLSKKLVNNMPYTAKYKRRFYDIIEDESTFTLVCYIEYEDKVSTLSS